MPARGPPAPAPFPAARRASSSSSGSGGRRSRQTTLDPPRRVRQRVEAPPEPPRYTNVSRPGAARPDASRPDASAPRRQSDAHEVIVLDDAED